MEYEYGIRIPKERIAMLIGVDGETKKEIEEATSSNIKVDSKEGEIFVRGTDALGLLTASEVVKAVGRGFNPNVAMLLTRHDYAFESIEIIQYARKSKNDAVRLKGRVIGREGKSRRTIESLTETHISVYGKTIGIIGEIDNVIAAKKAIEMLLSGSPHAPVYKFLEKKRKERHMREIIGLH